MPTRRSINTITHLLQPIVKLAKKDERKFVRYTPNITAIKTVNGFIVTFYHKLW